MSDNRATEACAGCYWYHNGACIINDEPCIWEDKPYLLKSIEKIWDGQVTLECEDTDDE